MRIRPLEVKALVPLLKRDWDTPEELAAALIAALDEVRASRTSYVGVMQFPLGGDESKSWYAGAGPYPGRKTAEKALRGDPAASLATALAVVPILTPEGLERRIRENDSPAGVS